jgi:hypothetical protein
MLFGLALDGRRVMDNSFGLKRNGVGARMARHPVAAFLAATGCGIVCAYLGSAHGAGAAAVMLALGAIVGAPLGAMLAASSQGDL